MKSSINIGIPVHKNGRYEVPFSVPNELRQYFKTQSFWYECPDASNVPDPIAIVPAVANLLPFSWVFNYPINICLLDSTFYYSILKIKDGYINMLPKLHLGGELNVENIINGVDERALGDPLLLFSGGVDAWCSLVRHVNENPHLVSIWGADIPINSLTGWDIVNKHSKSVAKMFGLSYSYVRSNLMDMIDYRTLDNSPMMRSAGYTWWHDLQHGIGLLSLTAPLAYTFKAPLTYIASSFYEGDKGTYTCASDPTIDNKFAVGSMHCCHDGYELTRQDKINSIVNYSEDANLSIDLRVCFHVQTGKNCCRCEKCGRTILGIYAAGGDPRKLGFSFSPLTLLITSLRMRCFYRMKMAHYRHIRTSAQTHKENIPMVFNWIYSTNLEHICDNDFKKSWERFHNFGAGLFHKLINK